MRPSSARPSVQRSSAPFAGSPLRRRPAEICFPSAILLRRKFALLVLLAAALLVMPVLGARGGDARAGTRPLFPRFSRAVPVLLYHRILRGDGRGVSAVSFDAQMRRLHDTGFEPITLDQYIRFMRGEAVDLPSRPILLTFDDGYASALQEVDPVLARYGWSAVMYIPTGAVGISGRLTWDELRQMQSSGRWEMQEHAGDGHVLIPVDAAGRRLPYYANELWTETGKESFSRYKQRVTHDVGLGAALLSHNLPGWAPHRSFAVPFGDYGQRGSNDPRIEPWFSSYLKAQFAVVFVQRATASPWPATASRTGSPCREAGTPTRSSRTCCAAAGS